MNINTRDSHLANFLNNKNIRIIISFVLKQTSILSTSFKEAQENDFGSYLKKGANFSTGGQMKREPIDVYELREKHWGK